jgi:hypothetical protein
MPPGSAGAVVRSSSVFHAPQASHRPAHLGKTLPQAEQAKFCVGFAKPKMRAANDPRHCEPASAGAAIHFLTWSMARRWIASLRSQ